MAGTFLSPRHIVHHYVSAQIHDFNISSAYLSICIWSSSPSSRYHFSTRLTLFSSSLPFKCLHHFSPFSVIVLDDYISSTFVSYLSLLLHTSTPASSSHPSLSLCLVHSSLSKPLSRSIANLTTVLYMFTFNVTDTLLSHNTPLHFHASFLFND